MLEIALLVCLIKDPATCKTLTLPSFDEGLTQLQYMTMASRDEVVKWSIEHPDWTVKRWRCQPRGRFANI
jgi:hypothetical protein